MNTVLDNTLSVLNFRTSLSRKTSPVALANITSELVPLFATGPAEFSDEMTEAINQAFPFLLQDCEVFFNMSEHKAMDALAELSTLACLYSGLNSSRYEQVCSAISVIRASYPARW